MKAFTTTFVLAFVATFLFAQNIIYVDADNGSLIKNGNSWATAYKFLDDAIDKLDETEEEDEIWVAEGTYAGYHGSTLEDIYLYGGFEGDETALNQRDPLNNVTSMVGGGAERAVSTSGRLIVDGFSVNGYTDLGYNYAVLFGSEAVTIEGCTFVGNLARHIVQKGEESGSLTITNTVFSGNTSNWLLLKKEAGSLIATDCKFFSNNSNGNLFSSGLFTRCEFHDMTANDVHAFYACKAWNCLFDNVQATELFNWCELTNSTVVDSDGEVDLSNGTSSNNLFKDNNFSNADPETMGTITFSLSDGDLPDLIGNTRADASFENATSDNYRLAACSPGINLGSNPAAVGSDLDGLDRIYDGKVDLGCYERQFDFPDRIYVDQNASGANNGSSWADAYNELRTATIVGCPYTEIWVAQGTYNPTGGVNRDLSFEIKTGMEIYGGFAGGETAISQRDIVGNPTILSGEIGAAGTGDNSYQVVSAFSCNDDTYLDGFIIQDGNANGGIGQQLGGGILCQFSSINILNSWIHSNYAVISGGGIYFSGNGNPRVETCIVSNNEADANGGGIYTGEVAGLGPDLLVEDCRIYDNTAAGNGGGVYFASDHVTMESCLLRDNSSPLGDGFANAAGNTSDVVNCTFAQNFDWALHVGGVLNMGNSIVWLQTNSIVLAGGSATVAYSTIEGGYPGDNVSSANPMFVSPFFNNFHLGALSPAINAGDNGLVISADDVDGEPRIDNGLVDMGMKETQNGCSHPHDTCEDALYIGYVPGGDDVVTSETIECASNANEVPMSCGAVPGRSIWFEVPGGVEGGVNVNITDVVGVGTTFNPKFAVYEGSCDNLTEILCVNDNGIGQGESGEVSGLINGETYYLRIEGAGIEEGTFGLDVDPTIPTITNATANLLPCQLDGRIDLEIVFEYDHMPTSGWLQVNGVNFNLTGSPQTVVFSDIEADGHWFDIESWFTASYPQSEYFVSDFIWIPCCVPTNDLEANSLEMEVDDNNGNLFHNRCATNTGDDPSACAANLGLSVWFHFEAQNSCVHRIEVDFLELLEENGCNYKIVVYGGWQAGELFEIACSDNAGANLDEIMYITGLQNGEWYKVKVHTWGQQAGRFSFHVETSDYPCQGDYDFSGHVDTNDLLHFLTEFSCTVNCCTDLTGDGATDTSDLLAFLTYFDTSCN